jgi:hypothetical protein
MVLDANMLIRDCFGYCVRAVLAGHAEQADFFVAHTTLSEANRYVVDHHIHAGAIWHWARA